MKLELAQVPPIYSEDTPNGRFYTTPTGEIYQSVTTFLSKFSDQEWLLKWKERVGEDEVNRVSTQAKRRGTTVHSIIERYLLGESDYSRGVMPNNLIMAQSIIKVLEKDLSVVRGIEVGLWSHLMKLAGRVDLFGTYMGRESIIDFKTSKYPKKEEDILNYFLQCTIYSIMAEEVFKIKVPQIVVIIGVDHEDAQVFVKRRKEYLGHLIKMFKAQ